MDQTLARIKKEAEEEVRAETHRKMVEEYKEVVRRRQNFWIKRFPWRLKIVRRDLPSPNRGEARDQCVRKLRDLGYGVREHKLYGTFIVEETGGK